MILKDIAFMQLDLPELYVDYGVLENIIKVGKDIVSDEYRYCYHIPLYADTEDVDRNETLDWTSHIVDMPHVKAYLEEHVFPWMGMKSRTMIICTPPGVEGKIHIDSGTKKFEDLNLKFRIVLWGTTSSFYYLDENSEKVHVPEIGEGKPFFIAGNHPHTVNNDTDKWKFTLAIGAPWACEYNHEFGDLLEESEQKFGVMKKPGLPDGYEEYFRYK